MSEFAISEKKRFETFANGLIGLPVSHIWRGYGSALFLEFGKLMPRVLKNGRRMRNDSGEMGVSIEWSWRIENEDSIIAGSWSDEADWSKYFEQLLGSHVTNVSLFGRLPEVQLNFSNGMYLCSIVTADGDPSWSISKRGQRVTESVSVVSRELNWESSPEEAFTEES